jgi:hypothetical protein
MLVAIVAVVGVTVTTAMATTVRAGDLVITLDGAASPRALPKSKLEPISFQANAAIATNDGSHVPPILSSDLQVDKHIRFDTTGLPTCAPDQLRATSPSEAMKACGAALIGKGTSSAQVEFPESAPFTAKGPLLIFNGPTGANGYPEQIYYVFAHVPLPTTFVVVGKISGDSGPYGYNISIAIPPIAGGAGSVTKVEFSVNRKWTYKGRRHSYLNAECANGRFQAKVEFVFGDGTDLTGDVVKSCESSN